MGFAAQVRHVFLKDVRRFWPYLAVLLAMIAVHLTVGLPAVERLSGARFRLPFSIGFFPLVLVVFCAALMLEDRPASDLAFWPTRPIHPGAMLVAKLLFVAVFLWMIPTIAHVRWVETLGGGGPTFGLTVDTLLYQGALLAVAAAAASVSRSATAFLAVALLGIVGSSLLQGALASEPSWFDTRGIRSTRLYLMTGVTFGVGMTVLCAQYLLRRVTLSVCLGLALYVGGALAVRSSHLDWTTDPYRVPERAYDPGDVSDIRLASIQADPDQNGFFGTDDVGYSAQIYAHTADAIWTSAERTRSRVVGERHDTTFDIEAIAHRFRGNGPQMNPFAASSIEGYARPGFTQGQQAPQINFEGVFATATHADAEALFLSGDSVFLEAEVAAWRPRVIAITPLDAGASVVTPLGVVVVEAARRERTSIAVEVTVRRAARAFGMSVMLGQELQPVLINRALGEFLPPVSGNGGGAPPPTPIARGARLESETLEVHFGSGFLPPGSLDESWFADAELAFVGGEPLGVMTLSLAREITEWPRLGGNVRIDGASPR